MKRRVFTSWVRKIHLYAALITASIFFMFILTSFMMIHHDLIDREVTEESHEIPISSAEFSSEELDNILVEQKVEGRIIKDDLNHDGDRVLSYQSAGKATVVKVDLEEGAVFLSTKEKSAGDAIIGVHRQRGYGGGVVYTVYALLLDLVGISLILFAITGVYLWLNLLKYSWLAWTIFALGILYFSAVLLSLL